MRHWLPVDFTVAVVVGIAAIEYADYIPDLSLVNATQLISGAPECNRYARLVKMEDLFHFKDSMDGMTRGTFLFRYLNAEDDASPIKAKVEFQYWDGEWHLTRFDYGCPSDCHIVDVNNDPPKS